MRPGHESSSLRVKMPVPDAILKLFVIDIAIGTKNCIVLDYIVRSLSREL